MKSGSSSNDIQKRKVCKLQEEEEEEAKVEKFFALIENIRERGDWLMKSGNGRRKGNKRSKKLVQPTFELQDFAQYHKQQTTLSHTKTKPTADDDPHQPIDLKLRL
ncbi:NIM1-interacting protein 1/3 [Senna tora]|uniref:NIM1-interacting protein 1/3 n=1 Tax=Senna tora TaxID=362788 RepID=A0A834SWR3_9FABA|nr:NIM1-interacting protein 1/3 [Senna tora]